MACKYRGPGLATRSLTVIADLVGAALLHQITDAVIRSHISPRVWGAPIDALARKPISYLDLFSPGGNFGAKILRP